jgi:Xaa-Pro aminopeptidase
LFIAPGKINAEVEAALAADDVQIRPYDALSEALHSIADGQTLLVDPRRAAWAIAHGVSPGVRLLEQINPSTLHKSRKSGHELAQIRRTMEHDGAALCEFFAWLETALQQREAITELTIDERVTAMRARRPGYVSPSFGTIAAFNEHGAAPHYSATAERHAVICDGATVTPGLLLIDSGGQYEGGTTDITRVVQIAAVTDEQRRDFTWVLKGMIALSRLRFPRGTRSPMIDAVARAPIWQAGIDYGHGTGHGVGYFLNVHEGPHSISPLQPPEPVTTLEPGMITSNEPGIYRPGKWGVRIENLLAVVSDGNGEFGEFLRFETLTLCPIDKRCIDRTLLDASEAAWLDAYHRTVRERLGPLVSGSALAWLLHATEPLA